MNRSNRVSASSVLAVAPSRIRELADIAMSMEGVLRLYFGESNIPTPAYIKDAAVRALHEGLHLLYGERGLPSCARPSRRSTGRSMTSPSILAGRLLSLRSGVQALNVAIRCVLNPGDEAVVLTPAWAQRRGDCRMCCARAVEVPHILASGRYGIDLASVEAAINRRTRLARLHFSLQSSWLGGSRG